MSILTALRSGVKAIDKVTKRGGIQAKVTLSRATPGPGGPTYGPIITLDALVDWKQRQVRTSAGILSVSRASIIFTDAQRLSSETNGEGIGDDDIITLPDGTTGPILDLGGFIDAGTGIPLATEVFLG